MTTRHNHLSPTRQNAPPNVPRTMGPTVYHGYLERSCEPSLIPTITDALAVLLDMAASYMALHVAAGI